MKSKLIYPEARPLVIERHAQLLGTGAGLPERIVTNQEIIDQFDLIASDRAVQFSIGIKERRFIQQATPPSKYLADAAKMCLENTNVSPEKIDRIIYARLAGDHAIPSTALMVLKRLGIRRGIPVMDVSVACSGFLHATQLALSYINSGDDNVLVIAGDRATVDDNAQIVKDTRTIFLNGDGFAAALYGVSQTRKFQCSYLYTDSALADFAHIPFGTEMFKNNGKPSADSFNLIMPNGPVIQKSILDSCRIVTNRLLGMANKTIDDIDFFITSDQTTPAWKAQLELLGIPEEKSCSCFHKYGNTVAAMVPLNLHEAISSGKLKKGMTVMMIGHGAGASGGGFIFTF